jgi:hypothetical protein
MKNKRAILRKDDDTLFITIKQIGGVKWKFGYMK